MADTTATPSTKFVCSPGLEFPDPRSPYKKFSRKEMRATRNRNKKKNDLVIELQRKSEQSEKNGGCLCLKRKRSMERVLEGKGGGGVGERGNGGEVETF
jgi:hypothetical protein